MGAESSIAAQPCARVVLLCFYLIIRAPFMGRFASPFIGEGKARVTTEEEEKKERKRGKKASKVAGSFFSFMLVPLIL